MSIKYANDAKSTLASSVASSGTSLTVASAASFPTLGAGDVMYLTLADALNSVTEIVKCTAVSGTTFTVVRGHEGTSAMAWSAGSNVQIRITAGLISDLLATTSTINFSFTATSSQTAFTGADSGGTTLAYTAGGVHVFLNGVLLEAADYAATDGTTITLGLGASTGDILQVVAYGSVVTVASSGGGGGDLVKIATQAFNGSVTSLEFTDCFSDTYASYKVVCTDIRSASGGWPEVYGLFSNDSGASYLTGYSYIDTTQTKLRISGTDLGSGAAKKTLHMMFHITGARDTASYTTCFGQVHKMAADTGISTYPTDVRATFTQKVAIDTFKIYLSSGTADAGTVTIYGLTA